MSELVVIEATELRRLVREAVAEALSQAPAQPETKYLDPDAAAALLGVHRRTVLRLVTRGELPSTRVGKLCRLKKADLDAYLAAGGSQ